MEGLLLLNSISEVKGFVGRGISTDGRSHYPMGSNDQTGPWYLGLWRYLDSGLADEEEKSRIHCTPSNPGRCAVTERRG